MKKLFVNFILICITRFVFDLSATAQQKINPAEVSKIILVTRTSALANGISVKMEVVNERGRWNSYLVNKEVYSFDQGGENKMSDERKRIATLGQQQINTFLNSIAAIKPGLDLQELKLTSATLNADFKKKHKQYADLIKPFIDDNSLHKAVAETLKDVSVYDTGGNCSIMIVKSNQDTIKLSTTHNCTTMLPWTINHFETYEPKINTFFIAAMGKEDYPNKTILSDSELKESIYRYFVFTCFPFVKMLNMQLK